MHESVRAFVGAHAHLADHRSVLEIGSVNINGGVRDLIEPYARNYVGIDLVDGPGVDMVMDAEDLPLEWREHYEVVVSCEAVEHCERPWRLIAEAERVLRPDGHLILTGRGFNESGAFPFHNPPDRYRFGPGVLAMMCVDAGLEVLEDAPDPQVAGWFILARKP